ncbi:hypothetical protein HMPREF0972_00472 [Actinomyces sp. oral taxon 848 str. F0332]|nr:hypothetical protein HMPREF0972_00472 [Actinomyces sp. oral taxon 848 str. F0332]
MENGNCRQGHRSDRYQYHSNRPLRPRHQLSISTIAIRITAMGAK